MFFAHLDSFLNCRFWLTRGLLVSMLMALLFTCVPAILVLRNMPMPPAYHLKAMHPLADTSTLEIPEDLGERSHGAKLTPRIVGAGLLFLSVQAGAHPYLPASLGGILFLLAGIVTTFSVSNDKVVSLLIGLCFAGLYACTACFSMNFVAKPFDGVAIGLVAATMCFPKQLVYIWLVSFLACFTDERSILALFYIGIFFYFHPNLDIPARKKSLITLLSVVPIYFIVRIELAHLLNWRASDWSKLGMDFPRALFFTQLVAWTCFKGTIFLICAAGYFLYRKQQRLPLLLFLFGTGVAILSCLFVLDISRAAAFAFPLIPAALAILASENLSQNQLRTACLFAACISLVGPNFDIIADLGVRYLPSMPMAFLWTLH